MISISNSRSLFSGILLTALFVPAVSFAQTSLALSVSPTLIELGSAPGESWQSSVKVINSNPFDLTVYASIVNFEPEGEAGLGRFVPVQEQNADQVTLAEWVTLPQASVTIPAQGTGEVPFIVSVPEDAEPGGHFAALLIGTQPPASETGVGVRTSQIVSSLFFLNVEGDIIENGFIRSFTASNSFLPTPKVDFTLRFENQGNVHLQPQGDIIIYNMWGTERGRIPINYYTSFGNALPGTIRKFDFTWEGSFSFTDIGLYRAVATISYGEASRQFTDQATYFWVIPLRGLFITLLSILGIILFARWAVRSYVRRMFALAGIDPESLGSRSDRHETRGHVKGDELDIRTITAPVRVSFSDLQTRTTYVHSMLDAVREIRLFVVSYYRFFLGMLGVILVVGIVWWFVNDATAPASDYTVQIGDAVNPVNLNAEEISFLRYHPQGLDDPALKAFAYEVELINVSGVAGRAGELAAVVVAAGHPVSALSADISSQRNRSVIVFPQSREAEALAISQALGGVLLSAAEDESNRIRIFVGEDFSKR
jgi:hypothetical protein